MNKLFLDQLNEFRHGFRVLDVTSLDTNTPPVNTDKNEDDLDFEEDPKERDDLDKDKDSVKKRDKRRARDITKYLQYVTASD